VHVDPQEMPAGVLLMIPDPPPCEVMVTRNIPDGGPPDTKPTHPGIIAIATRVITERHSLARILMNQKTPMNKAIGWRLRQNWLDISALENKSVTMRTV
jgi:hypothetical protein